VEGMDVVKNTEQQGPRSGQTNAKVVLAACK
jgi:hypothetical protein